MMHILITISTLLLLSIWSSIPAEVNGSEQCPEEGYNAIEMLEGFIADPEMLDARQETGTPHLTVSQIQILTDPEFISICEQITDSYPTVPNRLIEGTDEKFYHMVYYKVGEFYFVIIKLREHPDPEWYIIGLEAIHLYDSELNFIKGYSM